MQTINHPPSTIQSVWPALQSVCGLYSVGAEWKSAIGPQFDPFAHFLQPRLKPVQTWFCPRECGCLHRIIQGDDGSIVAVCRCDPPGCDEIALTPEDIVLWELNWPKLARAICQGFSFTSKFEWCDLPNTAQIGSWSDAPVPVYLTIQWDNREFRLVVASLVAGLKRPFILLAPTSSQLDGRSQGYLSSVGAEFFSLENTLQLTGPGIFQPNRLPGELFAHFAPQPKEPLGEDIARTAYAVLERLDAKKPPTPFTVWRLYGKHEMSAEQVAKQCRCSKATVVRRLKFIHANMGLKPQDLRTFSPHFSKIEDDISDSRAKSIYRRGVAFGDEDSDESQG